MPHLLHPWLSSRIVFQETLEIPPNTKRDIFLLLESSKTPIQQYKSKESPPIFASHPLMRLISTRRLGSLAQRGNIRKCFIAIGYILYNIYKANVIDPLLVKLYLLWSLEVVRREELRPCECYVSVRISKPIPLLPCTPDNYLLLLPAPPELADG